MEIVPSPQHGIYILKFRYNPRLISMLQSVPGPRWEPHTKTWHVPAEVAESFGWVEPPSIERTQQHYTLPPSLFDYQTRDSYHALTRGYYLFNYDTGTGKSATSLATANAHAPLAGHRTLILTPAGVRANWALEIEKWAEGTPVHTIKTGADELPTDTPGVFITSYELIAPALQPNQRWDTIIADESHYLKNGRSGRGKAATELSKLNPSAVKLALSATPITNRPQDLYAQLNWLRPGSFGGYKRFVTHYFECEDGDYDNLIVGPLKARTLPELKARLSTFSSVVSKADISYLFKPFSISQQWSTKPPSTTWGTLANVTRQSLLDHLQKSQATKVQQAVSAVESALAADPTATPAVLTFLRSTAASIHEALTSRGIPARLVNGSGTTKKRHKSITTAKEDGEVLVATMHSVGIGIDLTHYSRAVFFAELYWTPAIVSQAIGRFWRISNEHPAKVTLLGIRGTIDEAMSLSLANKLQAITTIGTGGSDALFLQQALDDDDELIDNLKDIISRGTVARDEYGVQA